MKIYQVGGAVRDRLLGLPVHDIDYVVVGSTAEEMLAKGFRPVGSHFPVFLHPKTQHEYALARTERKTAPGHRGFVFHADKSISLQEDLSRRDLSINALAQEVDESGKLIGEIIDPYQGRADLQAGILRHLSNAFTEDPLRILRVARFAARFPRFELATKTLALMTDMTQRGDLLTLSKERIWQELANALEAQAPLRFIEVLNQCGALKEIFPERFTRDWHNPAQQEEIRANLIAITKSYSDLDKRLGCLLKKVQPVELKAWSRDLKLPNEIAEFCQIVSDFNTTYDQLNATAVLEFFNRADVWRKPNRFMEILHLFNSLGLDVSKWQSIFKGIMQIDGGKIATELSERSDIQDLGQLIYKELQRVRFEVIQEVLSQ